METPFDEVGLNSERSFVKQCEPNGDIKLVKDTNRQL